MSKLYNILNSIITRVKKAETLPNWNQNDETAADYVKNRPFYTSDPVETVLIEEQTVTIDNDDYYIQLDGSLTFIEGETYKLTLNGVLYELVAKYGADWECTYIGNGNMVGETTEDTQPFAVDSYENGEIYLDVAELGDYTISISGKVFEVHKIDEKYLPEKYATVEAVETAQETANAAQGTADNAANQVYILEQKNTWSSIVLSTYSSSATDVIEVELPNSSSEIIIYGSFSIDNYGSNHFVTLYLNDKYIGSVCGYDSNASTFNCGVQVRVCGNIIVSEQAPYVTTGSTIPHMHVKTGISSISKVKLDFHGATVIGSLLSAPTLYYTIK